jgi:hypothetical protein
MPFINIKIDAVRNMPKDEVNKTKKVRPNGWNIQRTCIHLKTDIIWESTFTQMDNTKKVR